MGSNVVGVGLVSPGSRPLWFTQREMFAVERSVFRVQKYKNARNFTILYRRLSTERNLPSKKLQMMHSVTYYSYFIEAFFTVRMSYGFTVRA
jgi:hypothetical protein